MSISQSIVFEGQVSSSQDVSDLMKAGFIHITGLKIFSFSGKGQGRVGENLMPYEKGVCDTNNGMMVVITLGGEVWIRSRQGSDPDQQMLKRICPNSGTAYVYLSNGEYVQPHDIMARVANPYYNLSVPHSAG